MNKEKIIISVTAIFVGAIIAIGGIYLYQSSKQIDPSDIKGISIEEPTPTPSSGLFLTINEPNDEQVVDERTIKISGKTIPGAKIVILTASSEEAVVPTNDGGFSTDISLNQNENIIEIISVAPNGESVKVRRVVTFSTEDF